MSAIDAIDAIQAEIPTMTCVPGCSACCGPVAMTEPEWRRIQASRADTVARDLTCPMLDRHRHRCTVYAIRPTICRLFGVVRGMPCPKSLTPPLKSDVWGDSILRRVEQAAGRSAYHPLSSPRSPRNV